MKKSYISHILILLALPIILFASGCQSYTKKGTSITEVVMPVVVTEATLNDTDDPAIWIDFENPANSIILGTDKGQENGGIYVFGLDGKIDSSRTILNLKRPNNIDVEYGFRYGDLKTDIAVFTERGRNCIRVYSLPEMKAIDNGGIEVFTGEEHRDPMGIALYKTPDSGEIFAFVSRKSGPDGEYIWQYKLLTENSENVTAQLVRKFGAFKGGKEIEAIAVDNKLGYVYYSDETFGVRKYYASPDSTNRELAVFATEGFIDDHEGISIFETSDTSGYIIVSDQQANQFQIFMREGISGNPHNHQLIKVVKVAAIDSDGSEVTHIALNETFTKGLFVAMSTDKTFHFYRAEDIIGE